MEDVGEGAGGLGQRVRWAGEPGGHCPDLLQLSSITIEPVAQKKGLIVRHVEYCVKSARCPPPAPAPPAQAGH